MMRKVIVMLAALALLAVGCSQRSSTTGSDATSPATASACSPEDLQLLKAGTLTLGTDRPAYPPWWIDNDPQNGEGYEGGTARAVAEELGFTPDQIEWVVVPFGKSFAPGSKDFDFYIGQVSVTPERAESVDFSDGYYDVTQAVVVKKGSSFEGATTVGELNSARFGAEVGTTSLAAIEDEIQPTIEPRVYDRTSDATAALSNEQIDAIVVDMPTAFYALPKGSVVVGRVPGDEELGFVFAKGSPLVPCVNEALASVASAGTLDDLASEYLPDSNSVPELT